MKSDGRHEPEGSGAGVERAREELARCLGKVGRRWLVVEVALQRLHLIRDEADVLVYPVSTAEAGIDARKGSYGTPPGVHRIARKIGSGMPDGAVFKSREPTGEIWQPDGGAGDRDLILSRILTLEGLEDGVNRGPGRGSQERHIYIHGTNHEDRIGTASSRGCIRLRKRDVIDLFDRVEEGDPVVII